MGYSGHFQYCRMDNKFESEELPFKCYENLMIHSDIIFIISFIQLFHYFIHYQHHYLGMKKE